MNWFTEMMNTPEALERRKKMAAEEAQREADLAPLQHISELPPFTRQLIVAMAGPDAVLADTLHDCFANGADQLDLHLLDLLEAAVQRYSHEVDPLILAYLEKRYRAWAEHQGQYRGSPEFCQDYRRRLDAISGDPST